MKLHSRLKLLRHYLLGKTNGDQSRLIDKWYHSVDDAKPIGLWQEDGKRDAIRGSIQFHIWERIHDNPASWKILSLPGRLMAAACIAALLIGAYWLFLIDSRTEPVQYFTVTAPLGEIKQIQLPDSSRVWLKSGTTLQYSSQYGKQTRSLELVEGEAFFAVQKDSSKPFIVKAGQLETKVLGTAFNIQAYSDRPAVQVWVERGRVQVSDSTKVLTELSKGRRLQWLRADGNFSVDSLDWKQALAWQKGILVLESASFSELAFQLKEIYGVVLITNTAGIRGQHYDVKFFINKTSVNDIIATIAEVHGIRYKIQGKTITLY